MPLGRDEIPFGKQRCICNSWFESGAILSNSPWL